MNNHQTGTRKLDIHKAMQEWAQHQRQTEPVTAGHAADSASNNPSPRSMPAGHDRGDIIAHMPGEAENRIQMDFQVRAPVDGPNLTQVSGDGPLASQIRDHLAPPVQVQILDQARASQPYLHDQLSAAPTGPNGIQARPEFHSVPVTKSAPGAQFTMKAPGE